MAVFLWVGFVLLIVALLAIDLGVTGGRKHALTVGEALAWTSVYVLLAMLFNVAVYYIYEYSWLGAGTGTLDVDGRTAAIQFFTAWLIEKSLSVDNIFVIALVFSYFKVGREDQHRVLFWGILGALVFRGILIFLGAELLSRVTWAAYVFGGILIFTAVRMLLVRHDNLKPEESLLVRVAQRRFPLTEGFRGHHFLVREGGRTLMTPLLLALLVVESFDILFAIDSVPAALAITDDPFIVFTSNIFAVLGLRALYFVLAGYLDRLRYLKTSLVFLLAYVGVKMILSHTYPIPTVVSLAIISTILLVGVLASLQAAERDTAPLLSPLADDMAAISRVTARHAGSVAVCVLGCTTVALGLIVLMVPGSVAPVVAGGLGVLGGQVEWARRWIRRAGESPEA